MDYSYREGAIKTNDQIIQLTPMENELFKKLCESEDKFAKSKELLKTINYDIEDCISSGRNCVAVHMSRLNKKIKPIGKIINKKWFGYKLVIYSEEEADESNT